MGTNFLRRYFKMLRITGSSVILSAIIHVCCITSYYYIYLYLNPEDEGRKKFYSTTYSSKGVSIGGKTLGGGGIQTNHHKSYLFHLIKDFYTNYPKTFCAEFSLIYLIVLYLMGFFKEQANRFEDDNTSGSNDYNNNNNNSNATNNKSDNIKNFLHKRFSKKRMSFDEENLKELTTDCDEFEQEEEEVRKDV